MDIFMIDNIYGTGEYTNKLFESCPESPPRDTDNSGCVLSEVDILKNRYSDLLALILNGYADDDKYSEMDIIEAKLKSKGVDTRGIKPNRSLMAYYKYE